MFFLTMATAAMQPATPINVERWFVANDYSVSMMQRSEVGRVGFAVLVSPNGKPEWCKVIVPSQFKDLDDLSCELVMRRSRFTSATDIDGKPAYGLVRRWATWLAADNKRSMARLTKQYFAPPEDLVLTVNQTTVPSPIKLVIGVEPSGAIASCRGQGSTEPMAWVDVACAQAEARWKPIAAETRDGQAVATVQTVVIGFEPQTAGEGGQ